LFSQQNCCASSCAFSNLWIKSSSLFRGFKLMLKALLFLFITELILRMSLAKFVIQNNKTRPSSNQGEFNRGRYVFSCFELFTHNLTSECFFFPILRPPLCPSLICFLFQPDKNQENHYRYSRSSIFFSSSHVARCCNLS